MTRARNHINPVSLKFIYHNDCTHGAHKMKRLKLNATDPWFLGISLT